MGISIELRQSLHRIISWSPPWPHWLKLNFDGTKKRNGQRIGFIVRDWSGFLYLAGYKSIAIPQTHNSLELRAVWWGLKGLSKFYQGPLSIEGDSQVTLLTISKGSKENWRLATILKEIKQSCKIFRWLCSRTTVRQGNGIAD